MAKQKKTRLATTDQRSGGVYISGSARVKVDGDLVGRDKIVLRSDDRELDGLFDRLIGVIQSSPGLSAGEKQKAIDKSKELRTELKKPEPDLNKLDRIKRFLLSKGEVIAAAVGAVFQYPPVQETIKTITQRLIGG